MIALCAWAAACGYAPVRYADALGDAKTVAIVGLRNDTFEPGIEQLVADALSREFMRRGALRLVEDPARADVVISGAVEKLAVSRKSFSSIALALEYELRLGLAIRVVRRDGTIVPLDATAQTETERYVASADVEVERTHREEALRRLASLLAGRIHDALFERIAP
ncbi:MAG TPA: LPS assembly lipoprotein LptE [Myxococcota bacterium]